MSDQPTTFVIMCWDAGQRIDLAPKDRAYEAAWWPVAVVATEDEAKHHCAVLEQLTRARVEYREAWQSPALPDWTHDLRPADRLWRSWTSTRDIYPCVVDGDELPGDDEFDPYAILREEWAPGDHEDQEMVYAVAPDATTAGRRMMAVTP